MKVDEQRAAQQRKAADARAAKKKREMSERERVQKPHRDLGSPIGFGPAWEAISPQQFITRDPGDQGTPPAEQQPGTPFSKSPFESF